MRKHKYNQGDVLQFTWSSTGQTRLYLIARVSETHYGAIWMDDHRPQVLSFRELDDNLAFKLLVRG